MIIIDSIEALDAVVGPDARVDGRVTEQGFLAALAMIRESRFVAPLSLELVFTDGQQRCRFKPAEFMPAILDPFRGAGLYGELAAALMANDERLALKFACRVLGDLGSTWDFEQISRAGGRVAITAMIRRGGGRVPVQETSPLLADHSLAWIYLAVRGLRLRELVPDRQAA
jgi:hypothetical protein